MNKLVDKKERRARYQEVVYRLGKRPSFSVGEACDSIQGEKPRFIANLIKQLCRDQLLEVASESLPKEEARYRWIAFGNTGLLDDWINKRVSGRQIADAPTHERPRERLLKFGAPQLRTAELLAILIRTGRPGESALEAGERIVGRFHQQLAKLRELSPCELKEVSKAISEPAYCQIMAGIELGRRIHESIANAPIAARIQSSQAAIQYCKQHFDRLIHDGKREEVHIVTLDIKLQPIAIHQVSIGTSDASLVNMREVLRFAVRDNANGILLVHNHPSGDPTPSGEDFRVTEKLDQACRVMGIQLVDHIVVASRGCISIRETGAI